MSSPSADAAGPGVMAGGGDYRDRSVTQHEAAAVGYPLVATAVDAVVGAAPPAAGTAVFADLGAASGNNSLRPLAIALDRLRAAPAGGGDPGVLVVHTDLPGNDFRTLFGVVEDEPGSYLVGRDEVFPLVAGRSFYRRIFPAASLWFGWSASSLHWLSAAPGPIPDHFFIHLSHDTACQAAYLTRSRADWAGFLDHRAVELVPGGGLVIVDVLRGDDGLVGSEALFDALAGAIARQRDAGLIGDREYADLLYPTWFRSRSEIEEPFTPDFRASDGSRLELLDVRESVLTDPFADLLATGDAAGYARQQAGFLRAFLEPSFASQLAADRDQASRTGVLDAIFTATRDAIAADPAAVGPAYRLGAVRVRKPA